MEEYFKVKDSNVIYKVLKIVHDDKSSNFKILSKCVSNGVISYLTVSWRNNVTFIKKSEINPEFKDY